MPLTASGSRHSIGLVPEIAFATTPATPAFSLVRHNSTTLALTKASFASAEIRADRQLAGFRQGIRSVAGDIIAEFTASGAFESLLAMALMGAWVPVVSTGQQSLSAAVGSFARAAGSFVTDGFVINTPITTSGFATAGNNGTFDITAVSALSLTVTPTGGQVMAVDAAAAARQIDTQGAVLKSGLLRPSATLERNFADVGQYIRYRGCEIDKLSFSAAPGAIVLGTFTIMANDADPMAAAPIAGATYTPATVTQAMNSLTGSVTEGGTVLGIVSAVSLALANGMVAQPVIGSAVSNRPSVGKSLLTGSATVYFADASLYNKFVNETASSLQFALSDAVGNSFTFLIGNLKYTAAPVPVTNEGPVTMVMPFQALLDSVGTGTNLQVTRVHAL